MYFIRYTLTKHSGHKFKLPIDSTISQHANLEKFLSFQTRYNKKKKGPYKEAIRQAQSEARNQMIAPPPPPPTSTPGSVLDVCGSPREVNVLSWSQTGRRRRRGRRRKRSPPPPILCGRRRARRKAPSVVA